VGRVAAVEYASEVHLYNQTEAARPARQRGYSPVTYKSDVHPALAHWFAGSLAHWFAGSLAHWFAGSLVRWRQGHQGIVPRPAPALTAISMIMRR
jgi:hypothetical protein